MQFLIVYIREAHAIDSFLPKGGGTDPLLEDPSTDCERMQTAERCMAALALEPMPAVIDGVDDAVSRAYQAWPDRLYLVGRDGRIAYKGAPGPNGFLVDELQRAIMAELAGRTAAMPAEQRAVQAVLDTRCAEQRRLDDAHSLLSNWWRLSGSTFELLSTCDRRTAEAGLEWAEWTVPHLVRIFGVQPGPGSPPNVLLTRSLLQYNGFAITRPAPGRIAPESTGFSAFHHAHPCDSWRDVTTGAVRERPSGTGAGYWDDRTTVGNLWGPFSVRHAAAQAFVEAIDPSPVTLESLDPSTGDIFPTEAYWQEKQLPLWLRYGAAMYVERFCSDYGDGSVSTIRTWSLRELCSLLGLPEEYSESQARRALSAAIERAFAGSLSPQGVEASRQAIMVSGALVAFVVDGDNTAVRVAHEALREALRTEAGVRDAVLCLQDALREQLDAVTRSLCGVGKGNLLDGV